MMRRVKLSTADLDETDLNKLCRCCLSPRNLKEIARPNLFYGKLEVYSEMLKICFTDVIIEDGYICVSCIRKLRSSFNFKQCIKSARKHFLFMNQADICNSDSIVNTKNDVQNSENKEVKSKRTDISSHLFDSSTLCNENKNSSIVYTNHLIDNLDINEDPYEVEIKNNVSSMDKNTNVKKFIIDKSINEKKIDILHEDLTNIKTRMTNKHNAKVKSHNEPLIPMSAVVAPISDDKKTNNKKKNKNLSKEPNKDLIKQFDYTAENLEILKKNNVEIGEMKNLPYSLFSSDRICVVCKVEFSFYSDLVQHMPEHFPNHICDTCGKICATKKSLIYHLKIHDDLRLNCTKCDKTFKNKSNLTAHFKIKHKGEKTIFKCSECGEQLNTYTARIKHMVEKHNAEEKIHKCPDCPNRYTLSSHLRAHIRRKHLQEFIFSTQKRSSTHTQVSEK